MILLFYFWIGLAANFENAPNSQLFGQEATEGSITEQAAIDRFFEILKRNPRRGTAFDRVYGYHIEFGTMEPFLEKVRQEAESSPDQGTQWMVLGLFKSQQGKDFEAIKAFEEASRCLPQNSSAHYYLSLSLLRVGETDRATASLEQAIASSPPEERLDGLLPIARENLSEIATHRGSDASLASFRNGVSQRRTSPGKNRPFAN